MSIACTVGGVDGTTCGTFRMQNDPSEFSVMTCMMARQPEVAGWAAAHSGWEVRRWSCGISAPAIAESEA